MQDAESGTAAHRAGTDDLLPGWTTEGATGRRARVWPERALRTVRAASRRAIHGPALQTAATNVVNAMLGAATGILTARFLGPVGLGELAVALSILSFVVQTCDLSVVQTASYFVAKGREPGVVLGTGAPTLLFLAAVTLPVATVVVHHLGYHGRSLELNRRILLGVPVFLISGLTIIVPLGLGHYRTWNLARVFFPSAWLVTVLVIGFGLRAWTSPALVNGYLVVSATTAVVLVAVALRWAREPRFSFAFAREWLRYASSFHFGGLAATLNLTLDLIVVGAVLGSRDAGLYDVAVGFAAPVILVSAAYGSIALPEVAKRRTRDGYKHAESLLVRSTAFAVVLAAVGALAAPVLIPMIAGDAYRSSVDPFRVLLLAQVVLAANGVLSSTHLGMGRPWIPTIAEFVALALTVPLLVLLLPHFGIMGASWICIVTYGASFVVLWFSFVKLRAQQPDEADDRG